MPRSLGVVEFEKESAYSHIRVRKQGSVQTLLFVRDHGEEVVQSMVNLKKPYFCSAFLAELLRQLPLPAPAASGADRRAGGRRHGPLPQALRSEGEGRCPGDRSGDGQVADRYFEVRTTRTSISSPTTPLSTWKRPIRALRRDLHGCISQAVRQYRRRPACRWPEDQEVLQRGAEAAAIPADWWCSTSTRTRRSRPTCGRSAQAFGQSYVFHTADTNIIVVATMSLAREELPACGSGPGSSISASTPRFPSRTCSRAWAVACSDNAK